MWERRKSRNAIPCFLRGCSSASSVLDVTAWIDEELIADELRESIQQDSSVLQDGKYPYYIRLHALNEENLQAYAKEVGADDEQFMNTQNPAGIVIDKQFHIEISMQENLLKSKRLMLKLGNV